MAKNFKRIKETDLQTINPVVAPQVPEVSPWQKVQPQLEGQPVEATMIGTNENAAPSAVEQAAQRRQALANRAKQFVSKAGNTVREAFKPSEQEGEFVYSGASPAATHYYVAPKNAAAKPGQSSEPIGPEQGEGFDPDALDQQLRDETARNYEEALKKSTAPATTTEVQTVQPEAIQPSAQEVENALVDEMVSKYVPNAPAPEATATPSTPSGNYAVPTTEERQAWANRQYTDNTAMAQALEDAAAATDDPKQKALYSMMAERAREWEGWQNEENAYRRGQAQSAREMRERLRTAAQRRDQREYNDQDPSWADSLRKVPLVQNLIGVRRYNPETGEMEWHYPRNTAEGVGALLTSLPQIAHAAITGDNRLQREYRAMEQNQMFSPYKLDYMDMEDYRRGALPQPTPTWSDRIAAGMGEASFAGLKEQQRLQGIEATAEYIGTKYGPDMKNAYIKSQLGIQPDETVLTGKQIDQLIATADYLSTYPNANPEQFALLEGRLLDAIGQHSDPTDPYNARIQAALDKMSARRTRAGFEGAKNKPVEEFSPETAEDVKTLLEGRDAFDNSLLEQLPQVAQQELLTIAREYQNKLATDGEKAALDFARERIQNSGILSSLGLNFEDVLDYFNPANAFRYLPEAAIRKVAEWTGHKRWARDRERQGKNWLYPDKRGRVARQATTEDELVRLISEGSGNPVIQSLQRSINEANARKAEAIRNEMDNEMNQVNTTVY